MATARIRKAFRYPDDADNEPPELDEEEQEKLIADLQQQDTDNSKIYSTIYATIPAAAALFTLYTLLTASTSRQALIALLSLSSLLATNYIFLMLPAKAPDKKGKKPVYLAEMEQTPITRYLPTLNGALAAVTLLASITSWYRGQIDDAVTQALPFGGWLVCRRASLTRFSHLDHDIICTRAAATS